MKNPVWDKVLARSNNAQMHHPVVKNEIWDRVLAKVNAQFPEETTLQQPLVPRPDETQYAFVQRAMADAKLIAAFPDSKVRAIQVYAQWRKCRGENRTVTAIEAAWAAAIRKVNARHET